MNLMIGENLKRLRRGRNLTQEEVAAHLGISFQAISKWERGDGYPDITMLPALAHYFAVTVDDLIGMNQIAKQQKYAQINAVWAKNNQSGHHEENVKLMRESMKQFPNDALLLVQLSTSLEKLDGTDGEKIVSHTSHLTACIFCREQVENNPHQWWYVPEDMSCCICEECYQDFKERFQWKELDGWDIDWSICGGNSCEE